MVRLYVEASFVKETLFFLSSSQAHYLQNVMRLKEGDDILLFNGQQGEWRARIERKNKKSCAVLPLYQVRSQPPLEDLWLLFSPLKPKSQLFLEEKATELGIGSLLPVKCAHTNSHINLHKMKAHLIEAAEQSRRLDLPIIHPVTPLLQQLDLWPSERTLFFGDTTQMSPPLSEVVGKFEKKAAFLVGPEGGFSPQERDALNAHPQSQGVALSSQTLRAETAAIVGISWLQLKKMAAN